MPTTNKPILLYLGNSGQLSVTGSAQTGSFSTSATSINISGDPTNWLIDTNNDDYSNYAISTNYDGRIVTWCLVQYGSCTIYTSNDAMLTNTAKYVLHTDVAPSSSAMSYYGDYQTIVQGFEGFSTIGTVNEWIINYGNIYGFTQQSQEWSMVDSTSNICWKRVCMNDNGNFQLALTYNTSSPTQISTNNAIYQSNDYGSTWNIIDTSSIVNNTEYAILDICMARNGAIAYATVSNGAYNLNQQGVSDIPIYIFYSINENESGFNTWAMINYNTFNTYNLYSICTNYDGSVIYTGTFNYGNQDNIGVFKINIVNESNAPEISSITNIQDGLIEDSTDVGVTTYAVMGVLQLVTNNDGSICYAINAKLTQTITAIQEEGTQYEYTYLYGDYDLMVYSNNQARLISGSDSSNPTYNSICCSSYGYQAYSTATFTGVSSIQGTTLDNESYSIYASDNYIYATDNCKIILPDISSDTSTVVTFTIISADDTAKIITTGNPLSYLYGIIPASMNDGTSEATETSTITITEKYRAIFITSDTNGNFYFHFSSI